MGAIDDYLKARTQTYSSGALGIYKARLEREEKEEEERKKLIEEQNKLNDETASVRKEIGLDLQDSFVNAVSKNYGNLNNIRYNGETGLYESTTNYLDSTTDILARTTGVLDSLFKTATEKKAIQDGNYDSILKKLEENKSDYIKRIGADNYNNLYREVLQKTSMKGDSLSGYKSDYDLGALQNQRNIAWDRYYQSNSVVDKQTAENYDKLLNQYLYTHPDTDKQILSGTAQYIPQAIDQAKRNIPGTALALGATGLGYYLGQPQIGAAAGRYIYGASSIASGAQYTMEQTRGGEFGDMVSLGIPEDIARRASQNSAVLQTLIEEGETFIDIANAFKVPQSKAVTDGLKQFFKNWGVNIITEGLEEGSQSIVGFVYEKDAMARAGLDTSDYTWDSMLDEAWQEALGGAEIGATMYLAEGLPHIVVGKITDARNSIEATRNLPVNTALITMEPKTDDYGNKTFSEKYVKKNLIEEYDRVINLVNEEKKSVGADIPALDRELKLLEEGKKKNTTDEAVSQLTKGLNKALDNQIANKKQKLTEKQSSYATEVLSKEQKEAREKGFSRMEFSVADEITSGQKNVAAFAKNRGVNIVYYMTKNGKEDKRVYKHRGMWAGDTYISSVWKYTPDSNTIFVNARMKNTKNVLSVVGHEIAHINYSKNAEVQNMVNNHYTNEEAIAYGKQHGWDRPGFMSQEEINKYKEEMYADDIGEFLSEPETINMIEAADKSALKEIKNLLGNFFENTAGIRPQFDSLQQYNLEGKSVLNGVELGKEFQEQFLNEIKKTQSKKQAEAKTLSTEQKKNEAWYNEQKADNRGRDDIQKSLATRMNKGVNSQEVKDEMSRLEKKFNKPKRSAEITKDTATENWYDKKILDINNKFINLADYKDKIENSMSMKQAEEMIIKADRYRFGNSKSVNKTIRDIFNKKPSELIAKEILSSGLLIQKFIEPVEVLREQPDLVEGVVLAYKANALKGNIGKRKFGKINKTKDIVSKYVSPSFFETGLRVDDKKIIDEAFRTDKNAEYDNKVREARKEFIVRAHNPEWLAKNNIDAEAAYTLITNWSTLSGKELKLIEDLNKGVSYYNRWTGIENSSIIDIRDYSAWDLTEGLGISTSEKWHSALTRYVVATVLALDTHENWGGLMIELIDGYRPRGRTRAEYSIDSDEITIFQEGQNTVSHEMGHRLDAKWASELLGRRYGNGWSSGSPNKNYGFLTDRLTEESLENLVPTSSSKNFIKHFYAFLDDISQSSDLSSGYMADETEVFARFFAKFIAWTFEKANNNILEAEADVYDDVFTERQFKNFAKLLQEKSAVDQEFFEFYKSDDWKKYSTFKKELGGLKFAGKEGVAYLAIKAFEKTGRDKSKFFNYILKNKESLATTKYEEELFANITNNPYMKTAFEQIFDGLKELDKHYELYENGSKEGKLVDDAFNKNVYTWQGFKTVYTLSQDTKRSAEIVPSGYNETDNGRSLRLSKDRLEGIIHDSIDKWHPDNARNYLVRMSPEQFLQLTLTPEQLKIMETKDERTHELDVEELRDETQNIFLDVDFKRKRVTGHEGRHRMIALRNAGVKSVDVQIYIPRSEFEGKNYSYPNIEHIDELRLKGQRTGRKDGKNTFGKATTLYDLDPVTYNNQDYIREKYLGYEKSGDIRYSAEITDNSKKKKNVRAEKWKGKAKENESKAKENKRTAKGRGRALKWSWKKEEQQRKEKERWKARTKKREEAIRGLRAKAKEKQRVRTLNKAKKDFMKKLQTFEKSKAFKFMTDEQKKQYQETFGNIYRKGLSKKPSTKQIELIKANIAKQLLEDPNIVVSKKVRDMVTAPNQVTLDAIETIDQLNKLVDAFKSIVEQVQKQQQLVGLSRAKDALEEQNKFAAAVKELDKVHEEKKHKLNSKRAEREGNATGRFINALGEGKDKTVEGLRGFFETALSTLETELLRITGGDRKSQVMELYNNLNTGVTRDRNAQVRLRNILNKYLTDDRYKTLRKELNPRGEWVDTGVTVTDVNGRKHKLILDHGRLISLAMHSMQEQSLKHIGGAVTDIGFDEDGDLDIAKREGGGLTIPDMRLAKQGEIGRAVAEGYTVKLSPAEIDEIVGKKVDKNGNAIFTNLTQEENEFVKGIQEFFEQTRAYVDEVYRVLRGYGLPEIDNYFPIVANKAYIFKTVKPDDNLTYRTIAEAYGIFDKQGFIQERNPNAFNPIVLENVADVLTRMTDGVSKYYGYNIALHNNQVLLNTRDDKFSVEETLNRIAPNFLKNYETLTGFISGIRSHPNDIFARFRGRHAEFTLGLNPSSWVKQLLSVPTTMKYFTTSEMINFIGGGEKELYDTMKNYLEYRGDYEKNKVLQNFVRMLTPDLDYRSGAFGLPDLSDFIDNKSMFKKMDILKGIARFDRLGVTTVTRMFLYAELNRRGLLGTELSKLSTDEADAVFQEVGNSLERFLRQTQPDYSQVYRTNISRNSGAIARFITMYSTPALQMTNNLLQSAYELSYALKNGDKEMKNEAASKMVKSALGVMVASLGSAIIARTFSRLLKGEEDEDYDFGKEAVVSMLAPTLVLDDLARGFMGMTTYESQVPELIAYDAVIEIASSLNEIATGKPENAYNKWKKIVTNVGLITGIPIRDLYKIGKATLMYADSDLYYTMALKETPAAYKKWIETEGSPSMKDFYKAYTNTREKILKEKYGYVKADKEKGIKSNLKETYRKALEDVFPNDKKKVDEYMTILGGYKS